MIGSGLRAYPSKHQSTYALSHILSCRGQLNTAAVPVHRLGAEKKIHACILGIGKGEGYCGALLRLEKSLFLASEESIDLLKESAYDQYGESFKAVHQQVEQSARKALEMESHTALFDAVKSNHVVKVAVLFRTGAYIESEDHKGRNIIHLCTSADMVRLLADYGVNIHQQSVSGDSALHSIRHVDAAKELIKLGLSVSAKNNAQSTPLHHALDPDMVRLFLKHGADPKALNYYSYSPLHLVASRGIWEVVYFLLIAGCRVDTRGGDGFSAITLAEMVESNVLKKGDRSSANVPQREFVRLSKTIELMRRWQNLTNEKSLSLAAATHSLTRDLAWQSQSLLCRHPQSALSLATGLPDDIVNEIVVHYVGLFANHSPYRELNMSTIRQLSSVEDIPIAGVGVRQLFVKISVLVAVLSAIAFFIMQRLY